MKTWRREGEGEETAEDGEEAWEAGVEREEEKVVVVVVVEAGGAEGTTGDWQGVDDTGDWGGIEATEKWREVERQGEGASGSGGAEERLSFGRRTTGFSWALELRGMRGEEEGGLEERGVTGEEVSSFEEVKQMALGEPLYLMMVLPKWKGSSEDWGGDLEEGGGVEEEEGGGGRMSGRQW